MMQMLKTFMILATVAVVGCGSLEQRTADLAKTKLPNAVELPMKDIIRKKVSNGFGPLDFKFDLAAYKDNFVTVDHTGELNIISKTGTTLYSKKLKIGLSSGPTIYKDKAILGGTDGSVILFNLKTKLIEWQSYTSGEVLAAPVSDGKSVFAHSLDGSISALNFSNGRQQWRYTSKLPTMILRRSSTPLITENSLIAGFSNGKAIALDKFDGSVLWNNTVAEAKGDSDIQRMVDLTVQPQMHENNVLFASYRGGITAVRKSTGQIIWQNATPSFTDFTIEGDFAYVALTGGEITKISLINGKVMWKNDNLVGRRFAKPVNLSSKLLLADEDGYLHILNKRNGKYLSRTKIANEGIESKMTIASNKLFAISNKGTFLSLNMQKLDNSKGS